MTYDIRGTGEVDRGRRLPPGPGPVAMMPRFGMELVASPGLEHLAWYGRGPAETYSDRAFERVGVYTSTVGREWVEYARPQENGNKTDVRWVELTNAQGVGLRAEGLPLLSVGARHVVVRRHRAAAYSIDLPARQEIYLNLDMAQMGVGGIDSWTRLAYPMDAYRISGNEPHAYKVRLLPVARGPAAPAVPPREWIDPATGFRIVRLSEEARQRVAVLPPERLHGHRRQDGHRGARRPGHRRPEDPRRRAHRRPAGRAGRGRAGRAARCST